MPVGSSRSINVIMTTILILFSSCSMNPTKVQQEALNAGEELQSRKACAVGEMDGCTNLGLLEYKNGRLSESKLYYQKACVGGNKKACNMKFK